MFKVKFEYGISKSNEKLIVANIDNPCKTFEESIFFNGEEIGYICGKMGLMCWKLPKNILNFIKNENWILIIESNWWSGYMSADITSEGSMTKKWVHKEKC